MPYYVWFSKKGAFVPHVLGIKTSSTISSMVLKRIASFIIYGKNEFKIVCVKNVVD